VQEGVAGAARGQENQTGERTINWQRKKPQRKRRYTFKRERGKKKRHGNIFLVPSGSKLFGGKGIKFPHARKRTQFT